MENQICLQIMKNEMAELRDKLNTQDSKILSLSDELKAVKKEMCIHAKQERHMKSILEIVQSLGQYNQTVNEIYDKMKLIKQKCDKSILNKRKSNNSEEYLAENKDSTYFYWNNHNDNDINMNDTLINHVKNNSMSDETPIKIEMEDQIEENIDESLEINLNNQDMNFIDYSAANSNPHTSYLPRTSNLSVGSDKRSFKCDLCPKSFTNSSNLKSHLRVHTGEKPFKCTHCSKTFSQTSSLNNHLRVHTGERPFKCTICPKKFIQGHHLKDHLIIHHSK